MLKICERSGANLNRTDKSSIAALKKTVATSRTNVVFERVKSPFKIQAAQKTYLSTERGKLERNGMVSSLAPLTTLKQHNVKSNRPVVQRENFPVLYTFTIDRIVWDINILVDQLMFAEIIYSLLT